MTIEEIIYHTQELIKIPSSGDNPEALGQSLSYLEALLEKHSGITIERFESNGKKSILVYRDKKRPEKFDIILNAHIDVVPGDKEMFKPYVEDGKLYGRGSLDMKGTAVVMTDVFCNFVHKVPYSLALQIVTDEETAGYNGTKHQLEEGVRSDFVVIGEYANHRNTIYNAARGICWVEIAFKGKAAHGGHLWNGKNAVVKAGEFAGAVLKRYPTPIKETWTTTASVASITTPNITFNKVPDKAVLKIDFRFTQEDPVFRDKESLKAFISSIDSEAKLVNVAVFEPAVRVEALNPFVQGLSGASKKVTGKYPQLMSRPGASDGRFYALAGIDIVEYGLFGLNPHADGEYVEISSFDEYHKTLGEFLRQPIPKKLLKNSNTSGSKHLKILQDLVEIPSISSDLGSINSAFDYISEYLSSRGMHLAKYETNGYPSLVATTVKDCKHPAVLLNAHIDVVPGKKEMFELQIDGDKLIGRGVMDMKMAIASYLNLVDNLKDSLADYDFGIMITADEEIGSRDGTDMLVNKLGYLADVVIIPDGGENWQIESFAKGVHWIKLTAGGKSAHASRPWEGSSAIQKLLNALRNIELLVPPASSREDTILSVGTIEGGTTANQIPDSASAMLDIRYGNKEDFERIFPEIKKICKKYDVRAEIHAGHPPDLKDMNNTYVKTFTEMVTNVTGKKVGSCVGYGTTDGRFFSSKGIPTIVIEPESGNRHKDNEWLSRKGFEQFCIIIEQYVRKTGFIKTPELVTKTSDVARLANAINADNSKAYVWYATYGSGLSFDHFMCYINGGKLKDSEFICMGCRDKTPPVRNTFMSLPFKLSFAGKSKLWPGPLGALDVRKDSHSNTFARAYLITVEQFEDIAAQENMTTKPLRLPLAKAIQDGNSTIKNAKYQLYNELLFCGLKDNMPIFTLTAIRKTGSSQAPSLSYTQVLCQGLSEFAALSATEAVDYIAKIPGIAGHHKKQSIADMYKNATKKQR